MRPINDGITDNQMAETAHYRIAQHYTMFDTLNPVDLKKKFKQSNTEVLPFIQGIRDAQDTAFTKPLLLKTLIEKEIDSHKYIMTLRAEKENPILL